MKLTFFPIDVVQEIDGIFNHTVAYIAVVPEISQMGTWNLLWVTTP